MPVGRERGLWETGPGRVPSDAEKDLEGHRHISTGIGSYGRGAWVAPLGGSERVPGRTETSVEQEGPRLDLTDDSGQVDVRRMSATVVPLTCQ